MTNAKETTFTPGPLSHDRHIEWHDLPGEQEIHGGYTVENEDAQIICTMNEALPNFRDTAALFSAAPELYEALQRVNDAAYVDENTGEWRLPESFDTGFIDAALAKARGEDRSQPEEVQ